MKDRKGLDKKGFLTLNCYKIETVDCLNNFSLLNENSFI